MSDKRIFPPLRIRTNNENQKTEIDPAYLEKIQSTNKSQYNTFAQAVKTRMARDQEQNGTDMTSEILQNNNQISNLIILTNEVNELNKIFNITKMLQLVREFKNQLIHCNNQAQQFELFLKFCQTLNDG